MGIGFAIPSNLASAVIKDLRDDGEVNRGWLGVSIQGVTDDIAKGFGLEQPSGALVAAVQDNSPAAAAGLRSGDVILQWGDRVIETVNDLPRAVAFTPVGETLDIEIWRNREAETLSVTTAAQSNRETLASTEVPTGDSLAGSLERNFDEVGITLSNLTSDLRARFSVGDSIDGVLVIDVERDSEADAKGLRPGDVILSIGLDPVSSVEDLAQEINRLRDEEITIVTLGMQRADRESFVALRFDSA